jgi:hypothetical protein
MTTHGYSILKLARGPSYPVSATIPTPQEGHVAVLVNDIIYVFGGKGDDGKELGDLVALELSGKSKIVCATKYSSRL